MANEPKVLIASDISVECINLTTPHFNEIIEAFSSELPKNFKVVEVCTVDCPDLTKSPFCLAGRGLGGSKSLVDIGGPSFLLPLVNREKIYDFKDFPSLISTTPSFIIGAGAGPWPYTGTNCEMIANLLIHEDGNVVNMTKISKLANNSSDPPILEKVPPTETRFCLLGNFYCCNGESGRVIKVHCKGRIGKNDFITALRLALVAKFEDKPVGMGGVFLINEGKAKHHVMPDFSKVPLNSDKEVDKWLKYYEYSAPLMEVGTFTSYDPGLNLRVQHFHGYGSTVGGHYHYDTTPETVEYTGYLSVAEKLYRIDKPVKAVSFGSD